MTRCRGSPSKCPSPNSLQDDEQLQTLLVRHAARTTGAECVDALLRWCQLEFGGDDETAAAAGHGGASEGGAGVPTGYTPAERSKLVKGLSPDVAGPVAKAVDSLAAGGVEVRARGVAGSHTLCRARTKAFWAPACDASASGRMEAVQAC